MPTNAQDELWRTILRGRIWSCIAPGLKGYGDMIDRLIAAMPIEALRDFVEELAKNDEEEDEDE